jgi:hypothetical protein
MCVLVTNLQIMNFGSRSCPVRVFSSLRQLVCWHGQLFFANWTLNLCFFKFSSPQFNFLGGNMQKKKLATSENWHRLWRNDQNAHVEQLLNPKFTICMFATKEHIRGKIIIKSITSCFYTVSSNPYSNRYFGTLVVFSVTCLVYAFLLYLCVHSTLRPMQRKLNEIR